MTIYNFIKTDDPIYQEIKNLNKNEDVLIEGDFGLVIRLNNFNIYECLSDDFETSFSDMNSCYDFINDYLSVIQFENENRRKGVSS